MTRARALAAGLALAALPTLAQRPAVAVAVNAALVEAGISVVAR